MTTTRRLAAILAADVVGYSRLMDEDEAGTALREHREAAGLHTVDSALATVGYPPIAAIQIDGTEKMSALARAQNISICSHFRSSMTAASCSSCKAVTFSVRKATVFSMPLSCAVST